MDMYGKIPMLDQALWGAAITGVLALVGAAVAKVRCYAKIDEQTGDCLYGGGFTEHQLAPSPRSDEEKIK